MAFSLPLSLIEAFILYILAVLLRIINANEEEEMQRVDVRMSDEEFKELTRQAEKNKRTNPGQIKFLIEQEAKRGGKG